MEGQVRQATGGQHAQDHEQPMLARDPGEERDPRRPAVAPTKLAQFGKELDALRQSQSELAELVKRLDSREAAQANRISRGEIDAAVRRFLSTAESAAQPTAAAEPTEAPATGKDLLEELLALEDQAEIHAFWQKLREDGRIDEVIAAFEARAGADPTNPEVQLQLGQAYLQKIQDVGNGPLAGALATKADQAFDAALAADPQHWDARFHKAIALSFWPPVFGKQNAAISQFEQLAAQQALLPVSPEHAQTHLLLGNMYQQIGASEKAIAAWKAGLVLFPDNADLAAQLALVKASQGDG